MVSLISAVLAASLGFLVYLAVPFVVMTAPVELRRKVGEWYLKKASKCLKQFVFVRRVLSGYDVLPISVDDEQKLLTTTLSSSLAGEDNEYRFQDPDNRIKRLWNKPVALAFEQIPVAIDAELAELGKALHEKDVTDGIWHGDLTDPDSVEVDPWLTVKKGLQCVDPVDAYRLVINDVDAENIKTAEKLTKKRYEKYGDGVSAVQLMSGAIGFFSGLGGMMALKFFQNKFLDGGGGGGGVPESPVPIAIDATLDMAVIVL
jgi:hypothetical protein